MMKRPFALGLGFAALAGFALARSSRPRFSFAGKVCLITGGSRGLGLILARGICADGGRVSLLARDEAELARARAELTTGVADVLTIRCDLLDPTQIHSAVEQVVDHFGALDVVINNAGIIEVGPIDHMNRQDFERAMQLHFWAPFDVIMASLPHLRRRGGGRIVNIASVGGKIAVPHLAPYCASKFALVGLSNSLRAELARDNVRVTTVLPGTMRTGSHGHAQFKGDHAAEFGWFAAAASLPLLSMSAERAAAKILSACRRGQSSVMLPWTTRAAVIGDAMFPNVTAQAMKLANRMLPAPSDSGGDALRSGWESRENSELPKWVTAMGDRAAERNNEAPP